MSAGQALPYTKKVSRKPGMRHFRRCTPDPLAPECPGDKCSAIPRFSQSIRRGIRSAVFSRTNSTRASAPPSFVLLRSSSAKLRFPALYLGPARPVRSVSAGLVRSIASVRVQEILDGGNVGVHIDDISPGPGNGVIFFSVARFEGKHQDLHVFKQVHALP